MATYPPPSYGAYDQPSAPYGYPSNPQPGFVPQPGYPAQSGYPPQMGYPAGYPPQPGYPPSAQPTVYQPGAYYPNQPPTQTVVHQKEKESSGDCLKNCLLCALCTTLCCWCCSD